MSGGKAKLVVGAYIVYMAVLLVGVTLTGGV